MHNYHDEHGRLPPAVVYGKDGEPLYSWRVIILPYLEQQELYKKFHLDEPWDSTHNRELLSLIPSTYSPPGSKASLAPSGNTFLHVFVGTGTAFEDPCGQLLKDFPDGTSNTILLVEGGPAVPWTKPEEIAFGPGCPLPELATVFKDSFRVAFADGHVDFIPKEPGDAVLRAMITRNGGEHLWQRDGRWVVDVSGKPPE